MHTFRRINNTEWGVLLAEGTARLAVGSTVVVTKRDGSTREVRLGEFVRVDNGRDLFKIAPEPAAVAAPASAAPNVGDLAGVIALFDRSRQHLLRPAIVLSIPAINETIRINVAGETARVPGSLNVTSTIRRGGFRNIPVWYGRVHQDGRFEANRIAAWSTDMTAILARLREFAADPVRVAGEHGRLTGRCCFCHKPLDDPRSTAVGYGPICAGHYGLPWGDRPAHATREHATAAAASLGSDLATAAAASLGSDLATAAAASLGGVGGGAGGSGSFNVGGPQGGGGRFDEWGAARYAQTRPLQQRRRRRIISTPTPASNGPTLTPSPIESENSNPALLIEGSET